MGCREVESEEPERSLSEAERSAIGAEIEELGTFRGPSNLITETPRDWRYSRAADRVREGSRARCRRQGGDLHRIASHADYLVRLLSRSGYGGQIVLFNGTTAIPSRRPPTNGGRTFHLGGDQITVRQRRHAAALVDRFRNDAKIMIATGGRSGGNQPAVLFDGRGNYDLSLEPSADRAADRALPGTVSSTMWWSSTFSTFQCRDLRVFELAR